MPSQREATKKCSQKAGLNPAYTERWGEREEGKMDREPKNNIEENETFFERQQREWFENDCQGDIEDYGVD
jgi:hypothetical protein